MKCVHHWANLKNFWFKVFLDSKVVKLPCSALGNPGVRVGQSLISKSDEYIIWGRQISSICVTNLIVFFFSFFLSLTSNLGRNVTGMTSTGELSLASSSWPASSWSSSSWPASSWSHAWYCPCRKFCHMEKHKTFTFDYYCNFKWVSENLLWIKKNGTIGFCSLCWLL